MKVNFIQGDERISIIKVASGKFIVEYGIDNNGHAACFASGFKSFFDAYRTMKKHRPNAHAVATCEW